MLKLRFDFGKEEGEGGVRQLLFLLGILECPFFPLKNGPRYLYEFTTLLTSLKVGLLGLTIDFGRRASSSSSSNFTCS